MNQLKQLKQTIGFTFEAFSFIYGGILIGLGKIIMGCILLVVAFTLAWWTGKVIEKDAIENYKGEE